MKKTKIKACAKELASEMEAWIKSRADRLGFDANQFRVATIEILILSLEFDMVNGEIGANRRKINTK